MASYTQLTYHIVFGTKYRRPTLVEGIQTRLYEYIGGVKDHIHILAGLSASLAVADVIRDIKANSSKWMNEQTGVLQPFQWQKGYAAFTVSYSQIESVRQYVRTQPEHHKTLTFQEEYIAFLERHGIEISLEYLFEGEQHS